MIRELTFILTNYYEKEFVELKYKDYDDKSGDSSILILETNESFKQNGALKLKTDINEEPTNNKILNLYKQAHDEIVHFSKILTGSLVRFYNIQKSTSPRLFDIFFEKVKDLLVRKDLYNFLFRVKCEINRKEKEIYNNNLLKYYSIEPSCFCISPYFSMDKTFRDNIKQAANHIKKSKEPKLKFKVPFNKTISYIRSISTKDSILKKIDIMFKIRSCILNDIDNFWVGINIKSKYKILDADNMLSILIFVIIKSQISNFIIDIEIIDDFTDKVLKLSRKGYFFNLFKSSIEYIVSHIDSDQTKKNVEDYNSILNAEIESLIKDPTIILDET